jgi:hypothetical protein
MRLDSEKANITFGQLRNLQVGTGNFDRIEDISLRNECMNNRIVLKGKIAGELITIECKNMDQVKVVAGNLRSVFDPSTDPATLKIWEEIFMGPDFTGEQLPLMNEHHLV